HLGTPAVKATLFRTSDGRVIRSYLATLDAQVETKAVVLAGAIAKGAVSTSPLIVNVGEGQIDEAGSTARPSPSSDPAPRRTNRWFVAAGVAGACALAGGGLALVFSLQGRSAGDDLDRICAVSCTSEDARTLLDKQDSANRKAIVLGASGGVALAAGVVFFLVGRSGRNDTPVTIAAHPGGLAAAYAWRF
nr:hypothetical protein [Deltaproteobacteria bacterium]